MKRGNDEKTVAPMFPRLHVNDQEKGGPRAPPRNKMALYEQLSIPSQRVNTSMNHPGTSSQGNRLERGTFFPHQLPNSSHPTEKLRTGFSGLHASGAHLLQKKKPAEEDFTVPIFFQSAKDHSMDRNGRSAFSSAYSGYITNKMLKESNATDNESSQEGRGHSEKNPKEDVACGESPSNHGKSYLGRERIKDLLNASADQEREDCLVKSSERGQNTDAGLRHESEARLHHDPTLDRACDEDKTRESLPIGNGDRGDDASETSMVDSVSVVDISPDDVVGIIGQKHFWKARKAISNQQRVFAVQVFELHRLIKVQKLIAESPHILLEDSAYPGKELKVSPKRKLPLNYILGPSPNIAKINGDDTENANNKEFSAENAIRKLSPPSVVQNNGHPSSIGPFSGNPPPPAFTDPKMSPWCFPQPTGHQWLVPVMSPTEGLVYKPYDGHGFVGPGLEPNLMQNFINPQYGAPGPFPQAAGFPPVSPQVSHGFFPPYGMPMTNSVISSSAVEQPGRFGGPGSAGRPGPASDVDGGNSNKAHQSSCNQPIRRPSARSKLAPKESELQGSTASSPGEKGRGHEERSTLSLFPASPTVRGPVQAARGGSSGVIRVVPHNARSATESVARIFRSIQEERKQLESV